LKYRMQADFHSESVDSRFDYPSVVGIMGGASRCPLES
jgi:hypothetical protein